VTQRTCIVSWTDPQGVERKVEVAAATLFEAVARGLGVFRAAGWVDDIANHVTEVSVTVRQPDVVHRVRMRNFAQWVQRSGRSPAETVRIGEMRRLLGL
jgi:hypothetical protein